MTQLANPPRRSDWGDPPAGGRVRLKPMKRLAIVPVVAPPAPPKPARRAYLPAAARAVCVVLAITPEELRSRFGNDRYGPMPSRCSKEWGELVTRRRRLVRRRRLAAWLMVEIGMDVRLVTRIMGYAERSGVYHAHRIAQCEELLTLLEQVKIVLQKKARKCKQSFADAAERAIWKDVRDE